MHSEWFIIPDRGLIGGFGDATKSIKDNGLKMRDDDSTVPNYYASGVIGLIIKRVVDPQCGDTMCWLGVRNS